MLAHVMIGANDIEEAKTFYDATLGVLGAGEGARNNTDKGQKRLVYNHNGSVFCVSEPLDGKLASGANGGTIGFACNSPEQVKEFHDVAVAHGGTSIEDPPGLRENNMGPVHLSYVRDPAGNKLCGIYRNK